jgi:hypothetical protein
MAYTIYKQPDDLFAIWSSIFDDFVWYDCSIEDVIEIWKEKFGRPEESSLSEQMSSTEDMIKSIHPGRESFVNRFRWRDFVHAAGDDHDENDPYQAWLAKWRGVT